MNSPYSYSSKSSAPSAPVADSAIAEGEVVFALQAEMVSSDTNVPLALVVDAPANMPSSDIGLYPSLPSTLSYLPLAPPSPAPLSTPTATTTSVLASNDSVLSKEPGDASSEEYKSLLLRVDQLLAAGKITPDMKQTFLSIASSGNIQGALKFVDAFNTIASVPAPAPGPGLATPSRALPSSSSSSTSAPSSPSVSSTPTQLITPKNSSKPASNNSNPTLSSGSDNEQQSGNKNANNNIDDEDEETLRKMAELRIQQVKAQESLQKSNVSKTLAFNHAKKARDLYNSGSLKEAYLSYKQSLVSFFDVLQLKRDVGIRKEIIPAMSSSLEQMIKIESSVQEKLPFEEFGKILGEMQRFGFDVSNLSYFAATEAEKASKSGNPALAKKLYSLSINYLLSKSEFEKAEHMEVDEKALELIEFLLKKMQSLSS